MQIPLNEIFLEGEGGGGELGETMGITNCVENNIASHY
jgi:hypothetical protein